MPPTTATSGAYWADEVELELYADTALGAARELSLFEIPDAAERSWQQWWDQVAATAQKQFEGEGHIWDHPQPEHIHRHLILEDIDSNYTPCAHEHRDLPSTAKWDCTEV